MRSREQIAQDRRPATLHDGLLTGVRVEPASRRRRARVELEIEDVWLKNWHLSFVRPLDARLDLDFDVMRDNTPWMIDAWYAACDDSTIRSFIESQAPSLNVEYYDVNDRQYEQPDREAKLDDPSGLVLFRLTLHGGTIEVVARDFKLVRRRPGT